MGGALHKARSDAWDAPLSEADRWRAYETARNTPWHKAAEWAAGEFGVPPPSRSAWYRWLARMRREEAAERLARAAAAVSEAKRLAGEAGGDDALEDALKTLAADAAINASDPEAALRYVRMAASVAASSARREQLRLAAGAQRTREGQLALAREKFEAAERRENAAKAALGDRKLTDADKVAKMKEIFG